MATESVGGLDVQDFAQRVIDGNIVLQKFGDAYLITTKQYKVMDGKEDEPKFGKIEIAQLDAQVEQIDTQIAQLKTMKATIAEVKTALLKL